MLRLIWVGQHYKCLSHENSILHTAVLANTLVGLLEETIRYHYSMLK